MLLYAMHSGPYFSIALCIYLVFLSALLHSAAGGEICEEINSKYCSLRATTPSIVVTDL